MILCSLYIGTNDLVHRECQEVAEEMEKLITDVKVHADKVAASGVIKRYDGKFRANKISEYNKLPRDHGQKFRTCARS